MPEFAVARTIVQRDVRDIAEVEKMDQMSRLLKVLAHHSGQLTNFTQIGGQIGLDDRTARKYVAALEQLFLGSSPRTLVPQSAQATSEDSQAALS